MFRLITPGARRPQNLHASAPQAQCTSRSGTANLNLLKAVTRFACLSCALWNPCKGQAEPSVEYPSAWLCQRPRQLGWSRSPHQHYSLAHPGVQHEASLQASGVFSAGTCPQLGKKTAGVLVTSGEDKEVNVWALGCQSW